MSWEPRSPAGPSLPPGGCTHLVLDFDCTLSQIHLYHTLRGEGGQAALKRDSVGFFTEIFGGRARVEKLKAWLERLKAGGVVTSILSNGYEEEIVAALQTVGLRDAISGQVAGVAAQDAAGTEDKPSFLARYALQVRADHVVFADDDRANFPAPKARALDAWTLVARGAGGGSSGTRGRRDVSEPSSALPAVALVAWPAGQGEGGTGLDEAALQGIERLCLGDTSRRS